MGGRSTRRRGVAADRLKRQRAGIDRLNRAFGYAGTLELPASEAADRKARLLAALGFGTRQRKGDEA